MRIIEEDPVVFYKQQALSHLPYYKMYLLNTMVQFITHIDVYYLKLSILLAWRGWCGEEAANPAPRPSRKPSSRCSFLEIEDGTDYLYDVVHQLRRWD